MKDRPDEREHRTIYPALDTMRAVASIAVVATHVAFWAGFYPEGTLGALTARLDFGVAVFFVLSGFLLGKPYLLALARHTPMPGTGRYFWHRALRILPVYWVSVVAALTLLPENDGAGPATWIESLTLTRLYTEDGLTPGLTQMWSLSTEVAFYLLLPAGMAVLARTICRHRWRPVLLVVVLAAVSVLSWLWVGLSATSLFGDLPSPGQWLPAYLSWFGVGLAFAIAAIEQSALVRRLATAPWSAWLAAAALLLIASTPIAGPVLLEPPSPAEAVAKNVLYALAAALLILPAIFAAPSTTFQRALSLPALRHLGFISYSLFCCHLVVLHLVFAWRDYEVFAAPGLEIFVLTLVISLLVSEVLYRVVELPTMRLRNLGRRTAPPATAEVSSPSEATTSS
ncbi:acyltransferase [Mumia sp. ZJ1417]|uniref:acyltransferase family protein n=1 Tax=Mumia sp. ZJ1417 TaxID=2708082 RepID=UPI00141D83EB|nr:acyltransferase [Mumia sp. ZJ1417]QMW67821.1 acyltransferase [Mumia sp. ZJ1417]